MKINKQASTLMSFYGSLVKKYISSSSFILVTLEMLLSDRLKKFLSNFDTSLTNIDIYYFAH